MTYREVINAVLRRLRETTISADWSGDLIDSTTITDYQKLIGDLVNEVKREVEDAWDWGVLRQTIDVTTVSGTMTYSLKGTNNRARIFDVVDAGLGTFLRPVSDHWMNQAFYPTANQSNSRPRYYGVAGEDSSGYLKIQFYQKPDDAYLINVNIIDPATDLAAATDVLQINDHPVILGAWARAIAERGEDGGSLSDMAQTQYAQALADAIAQDVSRHADEVIWHNA